MTGEGIVTKLYSDMASVKISKSSACGHNCASCNACSNPSYEITVLNPVGAKEGDRVLIETKSSELLAVSFLIYILPVFLLIISALVCESLSLGIYSIFVFAPLLLGWILLIKLLNKKVKITNSIVKILKPLPKKD